MKMPPELEPPENEKPKTKFPWIIVVLIVLIPIALLTGMGLGYAAWGKDAAQLEDALATVEAVKQELAVLSAAQDTNQEAQAETQPEEVVRYDVPVDDDPSIGPEDAEITLIEFSDYQCPFCQRWHEQVFNQLREEYPDQIRFVYRDLPLTSLHPEAVPAALAANCANEQGSFWEYHDQLFSGNYALGAESYLQIANALGLDEAQFEECYSTEKYSDEVQADYQYAANLGIQSTPTFFLNGIPIVGAQPYEVFKQVIEMELAGEIP